VAVRCSKIVRKDEQLIRRGGARVVIDELGEVEQLAFQVRALVLPTNGEVENCPS
jgi:hypothetical protein